MNLRLWTVVSGGGRGGCWEKTVGLLNVAESSGETRNRFHIKYAFFSIFFDIFEYSCFTMVC